MNDRKQAGEARKQALAPQTTNPNAFEPFLPPKLHYVSTILYIMCIFHCIFGVLESIPYICEYRLSHIRLMLFGGSKALIALFQIERLQLCFGKKYFLSF